MATRSIIAIRDNHEYKSVYSHWDGYPSGVGETLFNHYKEIEKVRELIELGNLSSLGENINPPTNSNHSFETPIENTTVFYMRDRGEKEQHHKVTKTTSQLFKVLDKCSAEWLYVYQNGKWFFKHYTEKKLKELTANDVIE